MRTINHKGHVFELVYEDSSLFLTQAIFIRKLDFKIGFEVLSFTRFNQSTKKEIEVSRLLLPNRSLNSLKNILFQEEEIEWTTV